MWEELIADPPISPMCLHTRPPNTQQKDVGLGKTRGRSKGGVIKRISKLPITLEFIRDQTRNRLDKIAMKKDRMKKLGNWELLEEMNGRITK